MLKRIMFRPKNLKYFANKILTHFIALSLILSNCFTSFALAKDIAPGIVPDKNVSGNNVYMDKSANDLPVVNINNPNGAGVSHNHFTDFNVGPKGAIINNSATTDVSIIGGTVTGNANLTRAADTIINEVTGTSRSQIFGAQEILGKSADYILANPNGISINGGEFINTQSATFTTGKVQLNANGQLEKLLIEKGDVKISGKKIDLSNLDYFDIIARSIKLNTEIHAKANKKLKNSKDTKVNIVAGAGEYNVKSKHLESKRTNYNAPSFAIDTSKLGGLYAGKIRLVSSEAGVGVNLPDIQSTTDNIEITADGKIIHKGISSAKKLEITSTNNKIVATAGKKATAQGNVQYLARGGIELEDNSEIRSESYVHLESSDGTLENKGNILSPGLRGIYRRKQCK